MHVLVAGAGIGGLTTAAALSRAGLEVTVLERAPAFAPVGAGLTVQPNALKALRVFDLAHAVVDAGQVLADGSVRAASGRLLVQVPVDRDDPPLAIHRATLHEVLLEAAGPERVRLGAEVTGASWDEDGVSVVLSDGEDVRGDVLIGADGIHSRVREALVGPEPPRYAGYTCWRGVVDRHPAWAPQSGREVVGAGRRLGMAHIDGDRVYWFAVINAPPDGVDEGPPKEILAALFGDFADPVPAVVDATPEEAIRRDDIIDRPVSNRWGEGRVTLLGDAAHAMTPNMGQGACQAIEDAVVLATLLRDTPDPVGALRRYEAVRQPRTAWFVRTSWRLGGVMQWEHPLAVWLRNTGFLLTPGFLAERSLRRPWRFALP